MSILYLHSNILILILTDTNLLKIDDKLIYILIYLY